jgi:hypothetical protein
MKRRKEECETFQMCRRGVLIEEHMAWKMRDPKDWVAGLLRVMRKVWGLRQGLTALLDDLYLGQPVFQ